MSNWKIVDFPHPDSPTKAEFVEFIYKFKFCKMFLDLSFGYAKVTPSNFITPLNYFGVILFYFDSIKGFRSITLKIRAAAILP